MCATRCVSSTVAISRLNCTPRRSIQRRCSVGYSFTLKTTTVTRSSVGHLHQRNAGDESKLRPLQAALWRAGRPVKNWSRRWSLTTRARRCSISLRFRPMTGATPRHFMPRWPTRVARLLEVSRGRSLCLFTSWSGLQQVNDRLRRADASLIWPVRSQGDAPRGAPLDWFRDDASECAACDPFVLGRGGYSRR